MTVVQSVLGERIRHHTAEDATVFQDLVTGSDHGLWGKLNILGRRPFPAMVLPL